MSETVDVKLIEAGGGAVLIEWVEGGMPHRAILPSEHFSEQMALDVLALGIPYGVPWAEEVKFEASPEDLQKRLREAGVWTADDALHKPAAVRSAVSHALGLDFGAVIKAAKKARR